MAGPALLAAWAGVVLLREPKTIGAGVAVVAAASVEDEM